MSKRLILGSFIAAASIALSAQTASAGCAEDLVEIKKERENAVGMNDTASDGFDRIIARAEAALAKGKKKMFVRLVKNARKKL